MLHQITCVICQKLFTSLKPHQKTCTEKCRYKHKIQGIRRKQEENKKNKRKVLKYVRLQDRKYPYSTNADHSKYCCVGCGYGIPRLGLMLVFLTKTEIEDYIGIRAAYYHPECAKKDVELTPEILEQALKNFIIYDHPMDFKHLRPQTLETNTSNDKLNNPS